MLEIGSKTINVDGITVFADHADPNQFWYLPAQIRLARRQGDNRAAFTFIKYGDIEADKVEGRGFLMFEVDLRIDIREERLILSRLSSLAPGDPKLSAVPFDEGSVACIALDLQGGGGTTAQVSPGGTFQAVESILGATVPSLHGDNSAAFSLSLSQDGTRILEKVFEEQGTPIGVVYNLKYTGLRPELDVEIKANFKRIYDHFSANLEGQVYMIRAGIEAGFEKLVQDGVIEIKVINYSTESEREDKAKWALDFFKNNLLNDWFKPTLTPGQLQGGLAQAENLTNVMNRTQPSRPQANFNANSQPTGNSGSSGNRPGADRNSGASEQPVQRPNPPAVTNSRPNAVAQATGTMPPVSSPATPVQNAGLRVPVSNTPNSSNISLDSAVVSFKLKYIRQIEDKTITLRYSRTQAVQRTYAPQGFFGLFAQDLSREGHFFEIDGDDPFFREFQVSIETPFDKQKVGLSSIHLQMDYGEPDTETHKTGHFIIDAHNGDKQEWLVKTQPGVNKYSYQVQYHFKPDSLWVGEQSSYEFPEVTTEDRTLMIHPFDHLGFLEVEASASRIDWLAVGEVELLLSYQAASGWNRTDRFYFTETSDQTKAWRLRLSDPNIREYTYELIYRLKDGTERRIDPVTTEATRIIIPNPFFNLDIEFIPLYFPGEVRMVFIDVAYSDEENQYVLRERLRMDGNSFQSGQLRLRLIDPSKNSFRYRLIIIDSGGSLIRKPFVETKETLIGVDLT